MTKVPKLLVLLVFALVAHTVFAGQSSNDCIEIKHLDIFGLAGQQVTWADSELRGLQSLDNLRTPENTSFLIPILVLQIADFHPACGKSNDLDRLRKLISIYLTIRNYPADKLDALSIEDIVDFVRRDFYRQIEDDSMLPYMSWTMDDGPLYGVSVKKLPLATKIEEGVTTFGKVKFIQAASKVYAAAFDLKGKLLWVRILTGVNPSRYLKRINGPIEVKKFEAATIVSAFVDGERLTLFTRPNGKFIFYNHSW